MNLCCLSSSEIVDIIKKNRIEYKDMLTGINIPFGCEIEFEEVNYKEIEKEFNDLKNNNFNLLGWKLTEDDSLDPLFDKTSFALNMYGGEIVSPILNNKISDWKNLKEVCLFLKRMNAKALDLSAAHIHFDNKLFKNNYDALKNILKLWALYEDIIFRFSSGFKDEIRSYVNLYSLPISNKIINVVRNTNSYDELLNALRTPRTNALSLYNFDKKINDSFEVRCPNGTLSEVIWQNNINFFKHLLETSLDNNKEWDKIDYELSKYVPCNYSIELYNLLNIEKASFIADFIYNSDKDKLDFMKQYVKM